MFRSLSGFQDKRVQAVKSSKVFLSTFRKYSIVKNTELQCPVTIPLIYTFFPLTMPLIPQSTQQLLIIIIIILVSRWEWGRMRGKWVQESVIKSVRGQAHTWPLPALLFFIVYQWQSLASSSRGVRPNGISIGIGTAAAAATVLGE